MLNSRWLALRGESTSFATFVLVWLGQTVSLAGSSLTGFALGIWVYQTTGTVTNYTLILLSNTLPYLLLLPLAGALVDRWNRRTVLLVCDLVAGLSTLLIALLFVCGAIELWQIYLANAVNALTRAFAWPAYAAMVPAVVPKEQLGRANGMVQLSQALAQIVAPLLATGVLVAFGMLSVFVIDGLTFGCGIATLLLARVPAQSAVLAGRPDPRDLLRGALGTWSAIIRQPGLRGLCLLQVSGNFAVGCIEVLIIPLVLSTASPTALGALMTLGGLGMLGGSLTMSAWGGPRRLIHGLILFEAIGALMVIAAGLWSSFAALSVCTFVYFFLLPLGNGCVQSIFQRKVALALQGRVFALTNMLSSAAALLGYLVAGPLADRMAGSLLAPDGALTGRLGRWFGVGPGRGVSLLFVVLGLLMLLALAAAMLSRQARQIETLLPDADQATGEEL